MAATTATSGSGGTDAGERSRDAGTGSAVAPPAWRAAPRTGSGGAAAIAAGLAAAAFLVAFAVGFARRERFVYFWDYAGYWPRLLDLEAQLRADPLAALRAVGASIRVDDYNLLAALGLTPLVALLGPSRAAYVGSIAALYGLLAVGAFAWLAVRVLADGSPRRGAIAPLAIATIALVPQMWLPVVAGYLDVAGCALVFALLGALGRPALPRSAARAAWLGIGLGLLPLVRRWYAYWVVALFPAMLVVAALDAWRGPAPRARRLAGALARIALAGLVAGVLLFGAATPIAIRMASTDFARQYAAYRGSETVAGAALDLLRDLGGIEIGLAAVGLALALGDRRSARLALLLALQAGCAFALFNRTQGMGWQHLYLLLPALVFFIAVGAVRAVERLRGAAARWAFATALVAALGTSFAAMFALWAAPLGAGAPLAFSRVRYPPLRRGDLPEVARLVRAVAAAAPAAGAPSVYVLASSTVLNDDVLRNARLTDPTLPDLRDRLLRTAHVDARDGFPDGLLRADLVVLGEPPQLHLGAAFQRAVAVPADEIRRGVGIGRAFAPLPGEFVLDGGVRARLYRRTAPPGASDEAELRRALAEAPASGAGTR